MFQIAVINCLEKPFNLAGAFGNLSQALILQWTLILQWA